MFKIIMIIAFAVLAICWIAYAIWAWRERKLEQQRPRERSQRYQQATSSVAEYAKKLAEFKKPTYKREDVNPHYQDDKPASEDKNG